jgi:hypothetical protein
VIIHRFDLGHELLVTEFDGVPTNQAVENSVRAACADPRTAETTRYLIDVRRASDSDASPNDLRHWAALMATYLRFHPRRTACRMAWLVGSDGDLGFGGMFEVFANAMGMKTQVFRDWHEALDWLGVSLADEARRPPQSKPGTDA